jgi:two-component system sensor histidine kinase MtrB
MALTTDSARDAPAPGSKPMRPKLGLRRRILLIFMLGSLALSVFLALTTFGLTRSNVGAERDETSINTTRRNAQVVQSSLRGNPPNIQDAVDALRSFGVERPLIFFRANEDWYGGVGQYQSEALPADLIERVNGDGVAARMVVDIGGEPNLVVGWPLPGTGSYFEFFSLDEVNNTLGSVRLALILAGAITTGLGVLLGIFAARRVVRPVGVAATAARAFADGRLDTRLEPTDDPDLGVLANSFNEMATALQQRVERDARFASDVSHELRSPLMTLSASVDVMDARRDEMPERARAALDLLKSDVIRFSGLVEDLLEISRFDAGAIQLHLEELLVAEFVRNAVAVSSLADTAIAVSERAEHLVIDGDRRRLARVIANLLDNARLHGAADDDVTIAIDEMLDDTARDESMTESIGPAVTAVCIAVEDHGPGVPAEERERIFERFARGGSAGRRAGSEGAGLGLSLVDEHIRLHGGRVWVEDRLDNQPGARFVIELPAEEITE